jgi:acyl-CoA thioesterase
VPGRYRANLSKDWCAPDVPQGGVMTVVALRAMQAELGVPDQHLRTVTNVFAAPVRSGPVDVDVTVLRRGRSMSQLSATVRSVGESAGHALVAVFGARRPGFEFTDLAPPAVPPPVHLFSAPVSEWVLGHNRARYAGDGYASLDMALWDPEVGLVAYATQLMLFLFPDGPPSPEQIRPRLDPR